MAELDDSIRDVISKHERWTFNTISSSPHDDAFKEDLAEAIEALIEHRLREQDGRGD